MSTINHFARLLVCMVAVTSLMIATSGLAVRAVAQQEVKPESTPPRVESPQPVALNWAMNAPRSYYKVYGYWPETWNHIVQCGLFTNELRAATGEIIDPDDRHFDFVGDIHYMYKGPQTSPVLAHAEPLADGTKRIRYEVLAGAIPYSQVYATPLQGVSSNFNQKRAELATNVLRRHQLAMMYQVRFAQSMFLWQHGRYGSWAELHQAGVMPFRRDTINPQTGSPWSGNGAANDLDFRLQENGAYRCILTDADGSTPWRVI